MRATCCLCGEPASAVIARLGERSAWNVCQACLLAHRQGTRPDRVVANRTSRRHSAARQDADRGDRSDPEASCGRVGNLASGQR